MLRIIFSIVLLGSVVCAQCNYSTTTTASTNSQANVQAAVTAAANRTTVLVPCGTVAWTGITIPNTKGITLSGQGCVTVTSSATLTVNQNSTDGSRVTGFTFTGNGDTNNGNIFINGSTSSAATRIDNNTFTSGASGLTQIVLQGNGPALIDHNTITTTNGAVEFIHNLAMGAGVNSGWTDDVVPGSSAMVFIEDNTFNCNNSTFFCSAVQSYYGARTVVRHNVIHFSQVDQHGTPGEIGARWWEVYDNVFWPDGKNQSNYAQIRAGSGVFWGNTVNLSGGSNTGGGDTQFAEEDTTSPECAGSNTWPCLWQIGMGGYSGTPNNTTTFHSSPAYYWGNSASMTLQLNGMSSNTTVQLNRDLFSSTSQPAALNRCESAADRTAGCPVSYTYVPYQYPHQLQCTAGPPSVQFLIGSLSNSLFWLGD
jgi:hypothetical protein